MEKLKIALTGGIGTGKTYISRMFLRMGFPVYYADTEAKNLYSRPEVINEIRSLFGESVFVGRKLDMKRMGSLIFTNDENRNRVNRVIHPLVMREFLSWTMQQKSKVIILESAIIYEENLESFFDLVMVVDASLGTRIARIKSRNPDYDEERIQSIIFAQMPQEEKCERADIVIRNEEELKQTLSYKVNIKRPEKS